VPASDAGSSSSSGGTGHSSCCQSHLACVAHQLQQRTMTHIACRFRSVLSCKPLFVVALLHCTPKLHDLACRAWLQQEHAQVTCGGGP
jgi:hypothetical protein